MISAIIMASGFSRRMGENKLLLKYKGSILAERVFKSVKDMNFNEVIVVTHYEEIIRLSEEYGFKNIINKNAEVGQSESIKLGLNNAKDNRGYMFFVADQPFIDTNYLNKLVEEFKKDPEYIVIPRNGEKTGNPVIFPCSKKSDLLKLNNDEKGKKVIAQSSKIKYVEVPKKMLLDIDTREEYEKLGGSIDEIN